VLETEKRTIYNDEIEPMQLVTDSGVVEELGMISVLGGLQLSRTVCELIEPLVDPPFTMIRRYEI
jgi:hypothetical protein